MRERESRLHRFMDMSAASGPRCPSRLGGLKFLETRLGVGRRPIDIGHTLAHSSRENYRADSRWVSESVSGRTTV